MKLHAIGAVSALILSMTAVPSVAQPKADPEGRRLLTVAPMAWKRYLERVTTDWAYSGFAITCAVNNPVSAADRANGFSRIVRLAGTFARRGGNQPWSEGKFYNEYGLKNGRWWITKASSETFLVGGCQYAVTDNQMGRTTPSPIE